MSRLFGRRREPEAKETVQEPPPAPAPFSPQHTAGQPRLYSPYAGLAGSFDPAISHTLMALPPAPEFLFTEEALVQQRSWSENLTFVTGVSYLAGAAAGGGLGVAAGLRVALPPGAESTKLRLNRVLNHAGKGGRGMGNSAGVVGLLFSSLDSAVGGLRDGRRDSVGTVVAAAGTGALYKSPQGARAAAVWALGGAIVGGVYAAGDYAAQNLWR